MCILRVYRFPPVVLAEFQAHFNRGLPILGWRDRSRGQNGGSHADGKARSHRHLPVRDSDFGHDAVRGGVGSIHDVDRIRLFAGTFGLGDLLDPEVAAAKIVREA